MRVLALVLVGCSGGAIKTETGDGPGPGPDPTNPTGDPNPPSLMITSPGDGATFTAGARVTLEARAMTGDGAPANGAVISWFTADGWSAVGSPIEVTDLPVGSYSLAASTTVGGEAADASVRITVEEALPTEPIDYSGTLAMETVLDAGSFGTFEYPCLNDYLTFELDGTAFVGAGACTVDAGFFTEQFVFAVEGTVSGASVSGTMTSAEAGGDPLPFSGNYDSANGHISASYDETYANSDGSLRLYGTFDADPVP
jgi:hypothetical protein